MKTRTQSRRLGFTLLELLVILGILAVLILLLLPRLAKTGGHRGRSVCVSNLKNVGLAFRIFATDNNDKFPMVVSHGAVPFDGNDHLSYFVGLNADETVPRSLLSGDNTITTDDRSRQRTSWILKVPTAYPTNNPIGIKWRDDERHRHWGNVALGDGSVQQLNTHRLLEALKQADQETVLAIPGDRD